MVSYRCSYSCGGVGHLSRDCVQGSKCYNCSGVVRFEVSIFQLCSAYQYYFIVGPH